MGSLLSRMWKSETSNGIAVNSARISSMANQFCFETGWFVTNWACCRWNISNCKHCSMFNKVTMHNVAGSTPSTGMLWSTVPCNIKWKIKPRSWHPRLEWCVSFCSHFVRYLISKIHPTLRITIMLRYKDNNTWYKTRQISLPRILHHSINTLTTYTSGLTDRQRLTVED